MKKFLFIASHGITLVVGFALGVYFLPILIEPPAADIAAVESVLDAPTFTTTFSRNRQDSDAFHWGEGELRLYEDTIVFEGKLAPGPDYRLYLVPDFVETEAAFVALKNDAVDVGSVKNFNRFVLNDIGAASDPTYNTAVIWCETFGQFITSGQYR